MPNPVKPRFYFEIPGVLVADHPKFRKTEAIEGGRYAPELMEHLARSSMTLVCLCFPEKRPDTLQLLRQLGLSNAQTLPKSPQYIQGGSPYSWRMSAISIDQLNSPSTFVWAGNGITPEEVDVLTKNREPSPHLLHIDPALGMTPRSLSNIEDFAFYSQEPA